MKSGEWPEGDYEEVGCFRCGLQGRLLYRKGLFGVAQCPRCGQVFTSPRLKEGSIAEIYADASYFDEGVYGFSKKFSLALLLQKAWWNGRVNLVTSMSKGDIQGRKMLEIGCAYGLFLEYARQRGFEVTGVEYSSTGVEWIRKHLKIEVYQGEIEQMQLPERNYDVICFWDVIEHVANPVHFLRAVSKLIKEDGIIAFSCPYFTSIPARMFRSRWWTLRPEQHLSHFTPRTLQMAFADAKLELMGVVKNPLALANLGRFDSLIGIARRNMSYANT